MLGIIGGSGLAKLPGLQITESDAVETPFGPPSSSLHQGRLAGRDIVFLARHGDSHTIPPHRINYRANIWALHAFGVREIAAVFSVGGIASGLGPGVIVVPDQILDYTSGREHTFFDGADGKVVHVDFTWPYAAAIRKGLLRAAAAAGVAALDGGTYGAVNGPRLETAAEIDRMDRDGATIVGMTGMPEAALARELGVEYAALTVSVNHAAGRGDCAETISNDQIIAALEPAMVSVCRILEAWVREHD
jgi:5'-methylthioadenosine phosphorylase